MTEVRPAPMSSEPLFHAEAILAVPLTLSLEVLQARLETLADDLMVELKGAAKAEGRWMGYPSKACMRLWITCRDPALAQGCRGFP